MASRARAQAQAQGQKQQQKIRQPLTPELDESFRDLISGEDMGMHRPRSGGRASASASASAGESRRYDDHEARRGMEELEIASELEIDEPPSPLGAKHVGTGRRAEEAEAEAEAEAGQREEGDGQEREEREERRSPAAVLGSKRVGVVVLPEEMKSGIQVEIDQLEDPRQLRTSYLSLPHVKKREEKHDHRSGRPRRTTEGELAKAAAVLPGEYAAVRNVMQEMRRRLGSDWLGSGSQSQSQLGEERGEVVEFSGGLGAGMWAALDSLDALPSSSTPADTQDKLRVQLVHTSRHGLTLAAKIADNVGKNAETTLNRKYVATSPSPPALVLSTFLLSTLPTKPSQQSHLFQLLSLDSPYLILIDRSTPEGWQAISSARSFILDQSTSESPLHVVAPCPHDGACPLVDTRDTCSFNQRLQRPSFLRKTKHSSRGEEDIGYCYLVIARGERPSLSSTTTSRAGITDTTELDKLSAAGLIGGVGREAAERARLKRDGRGVLTEIEGAEGVLEVVHLPEEVEDVHPQGAQPLDDVDKDQLQNSLRNEAYGWPRMVAPPMKRSGHVTIDACCPDGFIQRLTFSKSHSRQGYHDARKSSWGDLFPHEPKSTPVVRTRGVRRLSKAEKADEEDGDEVIQELMASEGDTDADMQSLKELEKLGLKVPKAEVVRDGKGAEGDVTFWKSRSASDGPLGPGGQRRGLSTTAVGVRPAIFASRSLSHTPNQIRYMSARPSASPSRIPPPRPKVTLAELSRLSAAGTPITCLTAYDYPTGLLSEQCGVDMCLVGDSLSQVALGYESTTSITLDEMIHHARAVCRGAKTPFVFSDMPFGSFESSIPDGVKAVMRMIKEGGVDGVKIEGGREILPLVKRLSEIGIPVIPHLGLQPQRATSLSGYLVQGRTAEGAYDILQTAREMKEAGAFAVLLEAIPHNVAKRITEEVGLTIGIGAGNGTSGQVLVVTDVLGTYAEDPTESSTLQPLVQGSATEGSETNKQPESAAVTITVAIPPKAPSAPRFVRQFGGAGPHARQAIRAYIDAVRTRSFPDTKESYGMKKVDWEGFLGLVEAEPRKQAKAHPNKP